LRAGRWCSSKKVRALASGCRGCVRLTLGPPGAGRIVRSWGCRPSKHPCRSAAGRRLPPKALNYRTKPKQGEGAATGPIRDGHGASGNATVTFREVRAGQLPPRVDRRIGGTVHHRWSLTQVVVIPSNGLSGGNGVPDQPLRRGRPKAPTLRGNLARAVLHETGAIRPPPSGQRWGHGWGGRTGCGFRIPETYEPREQRHAKAQYKPGSWSVSGVLVMPFR